MSFNNTMPSEGFNHSTWTQICWLLLFGTFSVTQFSYPAYYIGKCFFFCLLLFSNSPDLIFILDFMLFQTSIVFGDRFPVSVCIDWTSQVNGFPLSYNTFQTVFCFIFIYISIPITLTTLLKKQKINKFLVEL